MFVRTFVTPIYYGSGTGSGSDFFTSYGSGSTRQKVTVPTVTVPQHWSATSPTFAACVKQTTYTGGQRGYTILEVHTIK